LSCLKQAADKRFGGFTAVSNVSFEVAEARSSPDRPQRLRQEHRLQSHRRRAQADAGSVRFRGAEIGSHPAYRVAHAGIARTYQDPAPVPEAEPARERGPRGILWSE